MSRGFFVVGVGQRLGWIICRRNNSTLPIPTRAVKRHSEAAMRSSSPMKRNNSVRVNVPSM